MAIGTSSSVDFFGTTDEVVDITTSVVATGAFSDSDDFTQWTNDDDAPFAVFAYDFTMGGNPSAGTTVDLFARAMNISDTTEDSNIPSTTFEHMYLGSLPMDSSTTTQRGTIGPVRLPNMFTSAVYDFYVKNNSGQNLNTGSTVDITPTTIGPHA